MPENFDGIKNRKFGIEIEMTGITRCEAAKAIKKILGGDIEHVGGTYDKYTVGDDKGRKWQIVFDSSIYARKKNGDLASDYYKVELNSPVLEYEDFDLLQNVIRALRKTGAITGPDYDCGTHIHIVLLFLVLIESRILSGSKDSFEMRIARYTDIFKCQFTSCLQTLGGIFLTQLKHGY